MHLKKAADDLRLLNSGPRCGFNDLNVPARQAGSSIMPAKVNPVIPECVNQCCFTIFGMDVTVNWAVAEGQLQLNAFDPVMVHELLTGMALLTHAMETFRVNCVEGIEINADLGRSYAQSSPSISAALNHYIGYEHAADIAAEPYIPAVPCARWPANAPTCRRAVGRDSRSDSTGPRPRPDLPRTPGVAESTVGRFRFCHPVSTTSPETTDTVGV